MLKVKSAVINVPDLLATRLLISAITSSDVDCAMHFDSTCGRLSWNIQQHYR